MAVSRRRLIRNPIGRPCDFAGKIAIRRQRLVGVYAITSCTALHTCENLFHFPGADHSGIGAMGASVGEHLNAPGRSLIEETMTSLPASENKQAAASVFHWVNLDTGLCPMDPKAFGAGCQEFLPRRVTLKRLAGLPSTYTQSDANVSTPRARHVSLTGLNSVTRNCSALNTRAFGLVQDDAPESCKASHGS